MLFHYNLVVDTQILQTKLHKPRLQPSLMQRPMLIQRLNEGLNGRFTLISAPPGFGKTTLAAAWAHQVDAVVGWLSLDKNDNDPRRFLTYFISTCQKGMAEFDDDLRRLLQLSGQDIAPEPVLTAVLNQFSNTNTPFLLVLDDYHHIETAVIHDAIRFWLEHQPPHLHLALTSRTEPPLPLSRLRARGEMTEITLNDLRFSPEESDHFLRQLMNLPLDEADVNTLTNRTEGWAAGLQLAAAAMRQPQAADISRFVASFGGSNRLVFDYLVDEVLNQQPEAWRIFLLHTAVVDRLCGALCDALLADSGHNSQHMLEQLDAANTFIVPLDHERRWYRYHSLFADLLRNRLQQTQPEKIPELHGRASRWFATNGFISEAIEHALQAGDETAVIHLLNTHTQDMIVWGEVVNLAKWLQTISPVARQKNPQLGVALALSNLLAGQFADMQSVLALLDEAEAQITTSATAQANRLPAEINAVRAVILIEKGDTAAGLTLAEPAAAVLQADDSAYGRYLSVMLLTTMGLAYRDQGNTERALDVLIQASSSQTHVMVYLLAAYERGKLHQEMGQLHLAEIVHQQAVDWAAAQFGAGAAALPLSGAAHIGIGALLYERNQLEDAQQHLTTGIERTQQKGGLGIDRDGLLVMAMVRQARGDVTEANALMRQALDHAQSSPRPDALVHAEAQQVRLWLAQGNLDAATRWANNQQGKLDQLDYQMEVTAVSLAHVYLAQQQLEQTLNIVQRFLPVVAAGGRNGRLSELHLLQAIAHWQLGDEKAALAELRSCLKTAVSQGYMRLFLDLSQWVTPLLYAAIQHNIDPDYCGKLLALLANAQQLPPPKASIQPLIDALSEREMEVLHLVAEGLTNREIGLRLHLSPNTIKRHTLTIYEKLNVHSRIEAVARARTLGILS